VTTLSFRNVFVAHDVVADKALQRLSLSNLSGGDQTLAFARLLSTSELTRGTHAIHSSQRKSIERSQATQVDNTLFETVVGYNGCPLASVIIAGKTGKHLLADFSSNCRSGTTPLQVLAL
jgi:hypothetical protein